MDLNFYKKYLTKHKKRLAFAVLAMFSFSFFSIVSITPVIAVVDTIFKDPTVLKQERKEARAKKIADDLKTSGTAELKFKERVLKKLKATAIGSSVNSAIQNFYDTYIYSDNQMRFKGLVLIGCLLLFFSFCKAISEYCVSYNLSFSFYRCALDIRADIFDHILNLDYQYFTKTSIGELESRVQNDISAIRQALQTLARGAIQAPITLIAALIFLIIVNLELTLWIFLGAPLITVTLIYFARIIRKYTRRQRREMDSLNSVMEESFRNYKLIQTYHTMKEEIARFVKSNDKIFYLYMKGRIARYAASPTIEILSTVSFVMILLLGGYKILLAANPMDPSIFILYLMALTRVYPPIRQLAKINTVWQMARVSTERINQILQTRPEIFETSGAKEIKKFKDVIEFENVEFAYDEKQILDGINLKIERGKTVAIVGSAGAGKTTLVNLLPRLFDPDKGAVKIDGVDIREYKLDDLRDLFGIVTQEILLFSTTIKNNIAYGDPEPDEERIVQAAKLANAHEFIMELDSGEGYDFDIGSAGARLSGGQRQRLAIARAIYRNPQILIFDEATSSLDEKTQKGVQEAIEHLLENRTAFVIAHRLSTIRHADEILVVEHGKIIERGTHEQLLAKKAVYSKLYDLTDDLNEEQEADSEED